MIRGHGSNHQGVLMENWYRGESEMKKVYNRPTLYRKVYAGLILLSVNRQSGVAVQDLTV